MSAPQPAAPSTDSTETAASRRSGKSLAKRLIRYGFALGILILLFTQVSLGEVWAALLQAHLGWLAVAGALSLLLQVVIAWRLKLLTDAQGLTLSSLTLFEINLSTMFYALFLPGGNFAGLAVRFLRMGTKGGDIMAAGVALFIDRIIATISLCLVGIAFWLLERPAGTEPIFILMAGSLVALAVLCWAITANWPLPKPLVRLAGKLRLAMQRWRAMSAKAHTMTLALGMLAHLIGILVFIALAWSLSLGVGIISLGWVRSAVILATMIPISVAGLGLREGAMIAMLAAYGVGDAQALAMSLLVFGVVMVLPGLIGAAFEAHRLLRPAQGLPAQ